MTSILMQLCLVATINFTVHGRGLRICAGKSEKIKCKNGKVILVKDAFYGRDSSFRCIMKDDLTSINERCGSKNNALAEISQRCNNMKKCSLHADNKLFKSDCPKKTGYLEIKYKCVKGSKRCKKEKFQCSSTKKCISHKKVCNDKIDCPDGSDESDCETDETCGVQEIKSDFITEDCPTLELHRILGGCEAIPNSWPWTLQLRNNRSLGGTVHRCGAVLISPSFALTAKHCFFITPEPSWWQVVAGRHHKHLPGHNDQIRKISKKIDFPNPTGNLLDRDLTLIKFDKPFEINRYVATICLPTREPNTGDECAIAGWGITNGTGHADVLKQTLMPIADRDTCNKTEGLIGNITEYMICAGWKQGVHDACKADSGGPLMCNIDNQFFLEGITSWGNECGLPDQPGVYVNVFKAVDWIKEQMSRN